MLRRSGTGTNFERWSNPPAKGDGVSKMGRPSPHRLRGFRSVITLALPVATLLLSGCSGGIGDQGISGDGTGGSGNGNGRPNGNGGSSGSGTGTGGSIGGPQLCMDQAIHAGRAPLRRLTRFEYNNTVTDLFGDTTNPGNLLPPEELGNGFGNDADRISTPALLVEQYGIVAQGIGDRATATPAALGKLAPCAANVTTATEDTCARTIIDTLAPKVYRRPLAAGESDDLFTLEKTLRAATNATFASAISGVIQALL